MPCFMDCLTKRPHGQKYGPCLGRDVSKLPRGQKSGPFLGRAIDPATYFEDLEARKEMLKTAELAGFTVCNRMEIEG